MNCMFYTSIPGQPGFQMGGVRFSGSRAISSLLAAAVGSTTKQQPELWPSVPGDSDPTTPGTRSPSQLGPARRLFAGPFEKKGGKYIAPPKF